MKITKNIAFSVQNVLKCIKTYSNVSKCIEWKRSSLRSQFWKMRLFEIIFKHCAILPQQQWSLSKEQFVCIIAQSNPPTYLDNAETKSSTKNSSRLGLQASILKKKWPHSSCISQINILIWMNFCANFGLLPLWELLLRPSLALIYDLCAENQASWRRSYWLQSALLPSSPKKYSCGN